MKLHSGRTTTAPHLPPELQQGVLCASFEPCIIRRHIVTELLQQHHTPEHAEQDRAVRKAAVARMDAAEELTYKSVRTEIATSLLVSKGFHSMALAAERKWLKEMPMDITTFRKFCQDPEAKEFEGVRQDVVIELFPRDEFIKPPTFINEAVEEGEKPITTDDRAALRCRLDLARAFKHDRHHLGMLFEKLDFTIVTGLSELWFKDMLFLPRAVEKVKIIFKAPDEGHGAGKKRWAEGSAEDAIAGWLRNVINSGMQVAARERGSKGNRRRVAVLDYVD